MDVIESLLDKDDQRAYQALLSLEGQSAESDAIYPYFNEFVKMLAHEKSYVRVRGFRMICVLARWDANQKIEGSLRTILAELDDEKPIAVRQCLAALHELVLYKPGLSGQIEEKIKALDYAKYKTTMQPLIKKDAEALLSILA